MWFWLIGGAAALYMLTRNSTAGAAGTSAAPTGNSDGTADSNITVAGAAALANAWNAALPATACPYDASKYKFGRYADGRYYYVLTAPITVGGTTTFENTGTFAEATQIDAAIAAVPRIVADKCGENFGFYL